MSHLTKFGNSFLKPFWGSIFARTGYKKKKGLYGSQGHWCLNLRLPRSKDISRYVHLISLYSRLEVWRRGERDRGGVRKVETTTEPLVNYGYLPSPPNFSFQFSHLKKKILLVGNLTGKQCFPAPRIKTNRTGKPKNLYHTNQNFWFGQFSWFKPNNAQPYM